MRLGLAAWGFRETSLEKQLAITKKLGLHLLELDIARCFNDDLSPHRFPSEMQRIKDKFNQFGIELSCAAGGNDFTMPNDTDNQRYLDDLKRMIDICQGLGVKFLRIFAGFAPVSEVTGYRWDKMIQYLQHVAEYAAAVDVIPVVETHGGVTTGPSGGVKHFHSTSSCPATLLKMLSEIPALKINFDPANLFAAGIDHPEEIYRQIRDRVCYLHLKDFIPVPGTDCVRPAACGESRMNWQALLQAINDFHGPAMIEYENVSDVEIGSRKSLDFLYRMGVVNDNIT